MARRSSGSLLKAAGTGLVAAFGGALASAAAAGVVFTGGAGAGDPYYPRMGNTGYGVSEYDVSLRFKRAGTVRSTTTIHAVANTDDGAAQPGPPLGSFNLDFRGPAVTRLEVDGLRTSYARQGQELVIEPSAPIADGAPFEVLVRYKGRPHQVSNPDGSRDGWTDTRDGAVALGEPQQTPSWIPVNDHPTDKASWRFRFTTPIGLKAISNGELVARERTDRVLVSEWEQAEPMPSYLALAAIGRFRIDRDEIGGVSYLGAVDRELDRSVVRRLRNRTEKAHEFLETVAGPYPFASTGGVVDPSSLGFAMETQTRSYYPGPPDLELVIHEVAHQWYGNSVSVDRWEEIWLNEGFATYMEWLYEEESGGESVAQRLDRLHSVHGPNAPFWDPPPADPGGPENLFATSIYDRGALALEVLRQEIGESHFREVLFEWPQQYRFGNASTDDLYALIEDVTGNPRPDPFHEWLYEEGKPSCASCREGSASQARHTPSSRATYRREPSE